MKKKMNPALIPHLPGVGARVCLGCMDGYRSMKSLKVKLKAMPHTFVEGICGFKVPGVPRVPTLEPGEREYLERQKQYDGRVPF